MTRLCWAVVLFVSSLAVAHGDDWSQWMGDRRDGVWREAGILDAFPAEGPKVLWRAPVGKGYSGPAVVGPHVFVMDRVRATDKDGKPARPTRDGIPGKERVTCLDAATGKEVWRHEYERPYRVSYGSGPRATPTVTGGKVYALGAMGDLYCLDAKTGKPAWHRDLMKEYGLTSPPVWGFSSHPLVEGGLVYVTVGGEGSAVVALHADTGKEAWKALTSEEVGYSPAKLVEAGGRKLLVAWLSDSLNGLDPATGKVLWTLEYPVGRPVNRPAVSIVTPVLAGRTLFVSTAYHGTMAVELDETLGAPKVKWAGKSNRMDKADGLHSLMANPVADGGHLYGCCAMGEMRCLDAATGKQVWQSYDFIGGERTDCGTAFIVPHAKRFWVFNDVGELSLAELTPKGHKVLTRAKIIEPAEAARGRTVVWSHPAFARKCVFVRNDKELVCVSLAAR
ncbi:MAG: PQQ-binding-like beta-propeller repeat protein [Gemmataceae bacterium]